VSNNFRQLLVNQEICSLIFSSPENRETNLDESEIVLSPQERVRPDRVILSESAARVIEYKTGIPRPRDLKQLKKYVQALQRMEVMKNRDVTGYVVYTDRQEVKQAV
jgi:hypothetical protein